MSIAILLLDETPDNCFECYFRGGEDQYLVCCTPDLAGAEVCEYDERRPDFCPLRPLPGKMPEYGSYAVGWNDCLDEIGGGENV